MDEFKELLGAKKQYLSINLEKSKEMLCRGLRYFIGDDAKWLQGYDEIAEWLQDNKGKGLLLYGSNGRGKSVMCYNIIPTLISYYYPNVSYICYRANNIRSIQSPNTDYYKMLTAKMMFIDDFGTESITSVYGEKHDVFSDLVDIAEQDKKLLVLSTNLTTDEITKRYGIRTFDRLRTLTRGICLKGESMRNSE